MRNDRGRAPMEEPLGGDGGHGGHGGPGGHGALGKPNGIGGPMGHGGPGGPMPRGPMGIPLGNPLSGRRPGIGPNSLPPIPRPPIPTPTVSGAGSMWGIHHPRFIASRRMRSLWYIAPFVSIDDRCRTEIDVEFFPDFTDAFGPYTSGLYLANKEYLNEYELVELTRSITDIIVRNGDEVDSAYRGDIHGKIRDSLEPLTEWLSEMQIRFFW